MDLELELDRFLKIKTSGRDASNSNYMNFPYEATPYSVLQELANSGYITKKDKVLDYGCGKGRVDFYLSYATKAKTIGIEYDPRLYNTALENKKTAISSNKVEFININASEYNLDDDINRIYFFNPFSVTVLNDVIDNIKKSLEKKPREILLFFYYPSKEYLSFLTKTMHLENVENIDCRHLFNNDDLKEFIGIYKI